MKRLVMVSGAIVSLAFVAAMQGCGSSNTDSGSNTSTTSGGTGNVTSSAGTGNVITSTGGTATGAAGTASSAAGTASSLPPTGGTGGTTVVAAGGASGGSTAAGGASGGSTAAGGAGGATTVGPAPTACDSTVKKAGACTTEGSVCAKTCGPDKTGYKTETCTTGAYVEGLCTFPTGADYSCYEKTLPLVACTADALGPVASSACTAAACMPCGPAYQDSTMAAKSGACVCTNSKWSCASDKEWPPQ